MNFKLIFNNAKWIIICKVLQSLLQLIIGMFCARYLGPSKYGLINYAASIFAFVLPITRLGFDASLVNEYIRHPEKEGEIMGTGIVNYINRQRIITLIELVENKNLSLHDASLSVGIEDPAYASRLFKKVTGLSCREYMGRKFKE